MSTSIKNPQSLMRTQDARLGRFHTAESNRGWSCNFVEKELDPSVPVRLGTTDTDAPHVLVRSDCTIFDVRRER